MRRTESENLYKQSLELIPGGVNSPVRAFRSVGGTPIFMKSGEGCHLKDVDGNVFLDFCNSWGPLICGHRHPDIIQAIQVQMERALTFGTSCEEEVSLARYLLDNLKIDSIKKIRFVTSGTDAVMSALRLARGFTGRTKIIKFAGCYHGHADGMLVKAGSGLVTFGIPDSAGVPRQYTENTLVLHLDDCDSVAEAFKRNGDDIAAIIIEPIPANNGLLLQEAEYLKFLREITRKYDSLLIFDEVISGFRIGFRGAAGYYGIEPDMVVYGKIIGGGMPVGAFASATEIMEKLAPDGPVYQAGTLNGNPIAMSAGLAQLKLLQKDIYDHLNHLGELLETEFNRAELSWRIARLGSIFWFYNGETNPRRAEAINPASMEVYASFHGYCLNAGIYLAPSGYEVGFLSAPMKESDIKKLLSVALSFFGA